MLIQLTKQHGKGVRVAHFPIRAVVADAAQRVADEVFYASEEEYKPYLMQRRNIWMVDESDYVIAVWDGSNGGTGNCVKYAQKEDKQITIVKP